MRKYESLYQQFLIDAVYTVLGKPEPYGNESSLDRQILENIIIDFGCILRPTPEINELYVWRDETILYAYEAFEGYKIKVIKALRYKIELLKPNSETLNRNIEVDKLTKLTRDYYNYESLQPIKYSYEIGWNTKDTIHVNNSLIYFLLLHTSNFSYTIYSESNLNNELRKPVENSDVNSLLYNYSDIFDCCTFSKPDDEIKNLISELGVQISDWYGLDTRYINYILIEGSCLFSSIWNYLKNPKNLPWKPPKSIKHSDDPLTSLDYDIALRSRITKLLKFISILVRLNKSSSELTEKDLELLDLSFLVDLNLKTPTEVIPKPNEILSSDKEMISTDVKKYFYFWVMNLADRVVPLKLNMYNKKYFTTTYLDIVNNSIAGKQLMRPSMIKLAQFYKYIMPANTGYATIIAEMTDLYGNTAKELPKTLDLSRIVKEFIIKYLVLLSKMKFTNMYSIQYYLFGSKYFRMLLEMSNSNLQRKSKKNILEWLLYV